MDQGLQLEATCCQIENGVLSKNSKIVSGNQNDRSIANSRGKNPSSNKPSNNENKPANQNNSRVQLQLQKSKSKKNISFILILHFQIYCRYCIETKGQLK